MEKSVKDILSEMEEKMRKSVEVTRRELAAIRTGRASTSLLEGVNVDYYGTFTPLRQVSNILTPEPTLIVIQPWDKSTLEEIERAILKADIGLTPNNDGKVIRIPIPPLSEERRQELVRVMRKMAEEGRVAIRGVRHKERDSAKNLEKESKISKDVSRRAQEKMEELTHKYIEEIDRILAAKEKEVLEV
ncbi:ribosome recycling factor [bacterium]|nr:ribosome recycling factor [bacterium]MCK4436656.1 ribosome recycling factor [bacterium]